MSRRKREIRDPSMFGIVVVNKPLGWSSTKVVGRVRYAAGGIKTGHAGTLDPLATGIVICCLGKATKLVSQLMGMTKIYETKVDLSAFTTTGDREGERDEIVVPSPPSLAQISEVLKQFVGEIKQVPPIFSAVHINGQRAYKMARKGLPVEIPPRLVQVYAIDLLAYQWPFVSLKITCGKGTYIRSIGRDIGKKLSTGGHLASLCRTAVGPYSLDIALNEQRLEQPIEQADLIDPKLTL